MFESDLEKIRKLVCELMTDCLAGQISCEKEFSTERTFFMNKLKEIGEKQLELENYIAELESGLIREKDYNL